MRVAAAVGDVGPSGFARSSSSSSSSISYGDSGDELAAAAISAVTAASETPADVVRTVMEAVRSINEPYALHGAEVAIRYCSPTNRARRLTPQAFAQYLDEPWYACHTVHTSLLLFHSQLSSLTLDHPITPLSVFDTNRYAILSEWDEIELEEPEAALNDDSPIGEPESVSGQNTVMQDALVKRKDDESWTIVSWTMSKYSGRWLLDALSITEGDSTIFVKKDA